MAFQCNASRWETATPWKKQSNKGEPSHLGNPSRCESVQLLPPNDMALGITGEPLQLSRDDKMLLIEQPLPVQGEEIEVSARLMCPSTVMMHRVLCI